MKKRSMSFLVAFWMILSLLPVNAATLQFQDVEPNSYYYDTVEWALNHDPQITNGISNTVFSPDSTCKRCEVVTFLWRAFGAVKMTGNNTFEDVEVGDYFYDAVLWAAENGITTGTDETHFNPNDPCKREQVATFLWRACEKPATTMQVSPFADVLNKQEYSYTPVLWAYENGVTNGKTANTFAPADPCTRAQIVTFLYRAVSEPLIPAEQPDCLTFQPKVASEYMVEIFGEKKVEAWFNLVDAVMVGKDTFACPDQETYDWVMGQFPIRCFPVLLEVIDYAWDREHSVVNGVASFTYLVPREEAAAKIAEFSKLVEDILNETMQPGYSDFEKAVSLFVYFQKTYTYDYQEAEDNDNGEADYGTSYRLLTEKTGICSDIAKAYSYLLMQVGVDATTVMGGNHEWSYIRLNGKNYHVDATFALNDAPGELFYFLKTDESRLEDGFKIEEFIYCSNYSQDHPHLEYVANDETFHELWFVYFDSLDHENMLLNYVTFSVLGEPQVRTFDYEGY